MADSKKKDENFLKNIAHLKKRALDVKFDLDITQYKPLENIGIGAYGVVCSAIHKKTNDKVAIKKIPNVFDVKDVAKRTYREIKILKHFKHDNIIHIREILKPKENFNDFRDVYVVFDLMESDLHKIIYSKQELTEEHVRYFLYQILRGLKYIHSAHVIHRDLKPSNLLVNEDCQLRIGDFGMARGLSSSPLEPNYFMTQYVATRWYRAPEIMLSLIEYGAAVDMWSVGCIFAEMLGRKHLFPGKDSISQIKLIIGIVGSPNSDLLQLCQSPIIKNFFQEMGRKEPVPWTKLYPKASKKAINLLGRMLVLHPKDRITVEQALVHPYLNKYHDPDDEPICVPGFNFDFEKEDLNLSQLRETIHTEVMEYHKPRTPTLSFSAFLRAVPKSPDVQPPNIFKLSKSQETSLSKSLVKSEVTSEKSPGNITIDTSAEQVVKKEPASPQQIIITKSDDDDVFKKPLSAKNESNVRVDIGNLLKTESTDIEMLSAKSTDGKQPMSARDTVMKTKENQEPLKKEDKNKTISEDTKNLIKAALMSSSFKKRTDSQGDDDKPKPITAAMRQKEREDKRKKKKEKTLERKRKDKKKNSSKDELLTIEDKELLQRWAKMQKVNVPIAPKPKVEVNPDCIYSGVKSRGQKTVTVSSAELASIINQQGLLGNVKNEPVKFDCQVAADKDDSSLHLKTEAPLFSSNPKNVQQKTLNLLQRRLLVNGAGIDSKSELELGGFPQEPDLNQKLDTNKEKLNIQVERETTERTDMPSNGNFSVDFSDVQLGDLDFLTMVSSPDVTNVLTQNMAAEANNSSITTSHENFDINISEGASNSGNSGEFLHKLCSESSTQNACSVTDFTPVDLPQNRSPSHLSVSPNFHNQVSPTNYYSNHSPGSQHSVSPNQRLSPNLQFPSVSSQNVQHQQPPSNTFHHASHQQIAAGSFQQQDSLNSMEAFNPNSLFMGTSQTQNQSVTQSSHYMSTNQAQNQSLTQASLFMGTSQPQNPAQSSQNFLCRNQPNLQENSSSNSNSNSPPSLLINTQQAQHSFQQLFQMPGPSDAVHQTLQNTQVDLVALLAKQLSRSNVEDLCPPLALTPRGTGGGYGVGVDLDAIMIGHEGDSQAVEASPLSSSILADWMEVTGNLNIDMDALEQELTSPMALSYNDLNLYSS